MKNIFIIKNLDVSLRVCMEELAFRFQKPLRSIMYLRAN
jgi:hypothetical protein